MRLNSAGSESPLADDIQVLKLLCGELQEMVPLKYFILRVPKELEVHI